APDFEADKAGTGGSVLSLRHLLVIDCYDDVLALRAYLQRVPLVRGEPRPAGLPPLHDAAGGPACIAVAQAYLVGVLGRHEVFGRANKEGGVRSCAGRAKIQLELEIGERAGGADVRRVRAIGHERAVDSAKQ